MFAIFPPLGDPRARSFLILASQGHICPSGDGRQPALGLGENWGRSLWLPTKIQRSQPCRASSHRPEASGREM